MSLTPGSSNFSSDPFHEPGKFRARSEENSNGVIRHLRKFGWDLLGTFLILLGILTLLGILGLSRGSIINSWILFLKRSFGWGSFVLVVVTAGLGWLALRHSAGKSFPLSIRRVIALEGAYFLLLGVFSLVNNVSLERALAGKDGGTLGWGLAELPAQVLSIPVTLVIFGLLFLLLTLIGVGVFHKILVKASTWGNQEDVNRPARIPERKIPPVNQEKPASKQPQSSLVERISGAGQDILPPINLLSAEHSAPPDQEKVKQRARLIETKLAEFGVPARVIGFRVGPTVTQFALEPGYVEKPGPDGEVSRQKVKVSQISILSRDLALALSAARLRIETPVPGRSYVGIEVPNDENAFVRLRPILESPDFRKEHAPLFFALGRNVSGDPVGADLEKLPHLLIAGTTNSGKSVCLTAIATCLVMNNSPADLRLVMLDPKMVELIRFNGLPHLLGHVETEMARMLAVLNWAQMEMDRRYRLLADAHTRNLETYNQKMQKSNKETLPRIVILVDELSDLMIHSPEQTEHNLTRLAQMARATGIHLVVATQRPSVDVITGVIKANFPARISFAVASSTDSRVILDSGGADNLLGKGDMLFMDPQKAGLQRLQGIFVSDPEIGKIVAHWQRVTRDAQVETAPWEDMVIAESGEGGDLLIEQATSVVRAAGKASASLLQRRLRIGYPRAARLIDELEDLGIVGPSVGSGRDREVLTTEFDDEPLNDENDNTDDLT